MYLIDPARRPVWTFAAALAATMAILTLCSAAIASAPADEVVTVKVRNMIAKPRTEAEAQSLLRAIGNAAQEACGASSFSLPEVKVAVRHSDCWRDAVARAVIAADSRILADAHARAIHRNRAG